jgi:hypothetical protein
MSSNAARTLQTKHASESQSVISPADIFLSVKFSPILSFIMFTKKQYICVYLHHISISIDECVVMLSQCEMLFSSALQRCLEALS